MHGDRLLVPLTVFARDHANWFRRDERESPIEVTKRDTIEETLELMIPAGYEFAELPAGEQVNSGGFEYDYSVRLDAGKAIVRRRLRTVPGDYDKADYDRLRAPVRAYVTARQKMLVLRRVDDDPAKRSISEN